MTEIEKKEKPKELHITEKDDVPQAIIGPRSPVYDQVIPAAVNATKDTISVQIDDTSSKQLYSAMHPRIQFYNSNPDRAYDLLLAQRQGETFIKRLPKDSLKEQEA